MAVKKIIGGFQDALAIAQAGIKGTLESLRKSRVKPKKRTTKTKPRARPKKKSSRKNPTDPNLLARSVIEAAIGEPLLPKSKAAKKTRRKK